MVEPERPHREPERGPEHGRLSARPVAVAQDAGPVGPLPAEPGDTAAAAYVPPSGGPRRLVVVLHGAGGTPDSALRLLRPAADAAGLLLLAPASTGRTWDMIVGGYGPDVRRIDRAVAAVSARYRVGPDRYVLAGFSDGASYALSLGVTNGDLVEAVVAFSPGFLAPLLRTGRPPVFVSHGTADRVLPIDRCGRRVVRELRRDGYDVTYEEFAGGHEVPAAVRDRAVGWLTRPLRP
jgi:phospholipase/carboxylesterase